MSRVVNGRGDAVAVVGGEAEAVVLLEILIGSHTESDSEKEGTRDTIIMQQATSVLNPCMQIENRGVKKKKNHP